MSDTLQSAAYGGPGWSPRRTTLGEELGTIWGACGQASEWTRLRAVLLHAPGAEWERLDDPNALQMLDRPDGQVARRQHEALAAAYERAGVTVHPIAPASLPTPNLLYAADLFFMTPEGAILARPASTVRAGEERHVARRLADLGVPILRTVRGAGTFEGADAMWLDPTTVLLGHGLRTNAEGVAQVRATLEEMGVTVVVTQLPVGTMHLMGQLRIVDRDLALVWPYRLAASAVEALRARGYDLLFTPDEAEATHHDAFNFVTLGPRRILMPAGCPQSRAAYERAGITCHEVEVGELLKAAGGIGCMTGVIARDGVPAPQ